MPPDPQVLWAYTHSTLLLLFHLRVSFGGGGRGGICPTLDPKCPLLSSLGYSDTTGYEAAYERYKQLQKDKILKIKRAIFQK